MWVVELWTHERKPHILMTSQNMLPKNRLFRLTIKNQRLTKRSNEIITLWYPLI